MMVHYIEKYFYAVSEDNKRRSNLWKLVIEKDDESYLMSTVNGKDFKVSFHKSGEVHEALTSELTKKLRIRNQERFFSKRKLATPNDKFKDPKTHETRDISSKYEVAQCLMFASTELNNDFYKEEFSSKTDDVYIVKFSNNSCVIELWFCIAVCKDTYIENFKIMDKLMTVSLPNSGKELIVLTKEYNINEDLNNVFIKAKKQAKEMIPKDLINNHKQITLGLSRDNAPGAIVELNL